jgi:dUTP pyrophosphatase
LSVPIRIEVEVLPEAEGLDLPTPASPGSAGLDLRAAVSEDLVLQPGDIRLVTTGLKVAIPPGHEAQIRPRSGLALKHGITVPNAPGTMVIAPVLRAELVRVDRVEVTERGEGGFGSSGRS